MKHRTLRIAACALPALLLAACGTPPAQTQKPRFNLSGYSAAFKQGHADGCVSASGRQRRDERLFRDNADYMMGWNDGRSACK
ncbi:MAG: hypothetical protein K2X06_05320 [Burkholderiales bacterium]|nr:hypothetical protein [Burkholderiales bacterium]